MDMVEEIMDAVDGQDAAEQTTTDQSGETAAEDTVVDSVVDEIASSEGVPAWAEPEINNVVNEEVNKL
ncbi:hypothetical protein B0H66DRAFT_607847 [Apodospora peruviana]|uniref:Uncharacterized protein n=1 Tax=Apodospora peruviana TaxID=516989 RepID=A0AAE0HTV0_9PEZI|nr:hypothetical protein B0H66DRAFT_607847 [Apodospora peruviana]